MVIRGNNCPHEIIDVTHLNAKTKIWLEPQDIKKLLTANINEKLKAINFERKDIVNKHIRNLNINIVNTQQNTYGRVSKQRVTEVKKYLKGLIIAPMDRNNGEITIQ